MYEGFGQVCVDTVEMKHGCAFLSIGSKHRLLPWSNKTAPEILSMVTDA